MVEEAALPNMEVTMTGGEGERERRGDRCTISRVGGWRERGGEIDVPSHGWEVGERGGREREGEGIVHLSTTVNILSLDEREYCQTKLGRHGLIT